MFKKSICKKRFWYFWIIFTYWLFKISTPFVMINLEHNFRREKTWFSIFILVRALYLKQDELYLQLFLSFEFCILHLSTQVTFKFWLRPCKFLDHYGEQRLVKEGWHIIMLSWFQFFYFLERIWGSWKS